MTFGSKPVNKARHGDVYYIAASPPFRSRACWLALCMIERMVLEPKFVKNMNELHGKIASWAVTATSTIIFLGVVVLAPLISAAPIHQKIIALLLTAITTLGLYKFIYMVIFLIFGSGVGSEKFFLGILFLRVHGWVIGYMKISMSIQ